MEIPNNPLFEFAKSTVFTEPDFIYFDEEDDNEEEETRRGELGARLIISMILSASEKNISKLQALLCVFSGMTLRESARVCCKSHEYIRLVVESTKKEYRELYDVLTSNRYRIDCLIPTVAKKWTITNLNSNRKVYTDSLSLWCKKKKVKYHVIQWRLRKKNGVWEDGENHYQIKRNF